MGSIHSGAAITPAARAEPNILFDVPGGQFRFDDRPAISSAVYPVVIAPTHNNAKTLADVLKRIEALHLSVIVIDDGSTDGTPAVLKQWISNAINFHTVAHPLNLGKAAALRTGFEVAARAGFTHAITIDTDGQLSPEDIPRLLQQATFDETAIVLGVRDAEAVDYAARSRLGRWVSNQLVCLETGRKITDSQCGLRIYPLQLVNSIRCNAGHYGYETEIITRALWAGTSVLESPVSCRYFAGVDRVSHFKPFVDSVRALLMHARLILIAVNPIHQKDSPPGAAPPHSLVRQFLHWLNPVTAWRQVRHTEGARVRFSIGFALGIFIANLPIYGIQSVVALFVARRFRLHPVSVLAGVNIAVPPIGPLMIACGIAVGHLILHGSLPHWHDYHFNAAGLHKYLLPVLIEWVLGSIVLGSILGILSFVSLDFLLRLASDPKPPAELTK